MGADPIGALPAGQGNVLRAKAMDQSLRLSDEATEWSTVFIPPLHEATTELEWASSVAFGSEIRIPDSRRMDTNF